MKQFTYIYTTIAGEDIYISPDDGFYGTSTFGNYRLTGSHLVHVLRQLVTFDILENLKITCVGDGWWLLPSGSVFHAKDIPKLYTRLDMAIMTECDWLPLTVREHLGV